MAIRIAQANSSEQEGSKAKHGRVFLYVRYRTAGGDFRLVDTKAQPPPEQLFKLPLNVAVALARGDFQAEAVKDGHAAVLVWIRPACFRAPVVTDTIRTGVSDMSMPHRRIDRVFQGRMLCDG
jgi:hypothetical protein